MRLKPRIWGYNIFVHARLHEHQYLDSVQTASDICASVEWVLCVACNDNWIERLPSDDVCINFAWISTYFALYKRSTCKPKNLGRGALWTASSWNIFIQSQGFHFLTLNDVHRFFAVRENVKFRFFFTANCCLESS